MQQINSFQLSSENRKSKEKSITKSESFSAESMTAFGAIELGDGECVAESHLLEQEEESLAKLPVEKSSALNKDASHEASLSAFSDEETCEQVVQQVSKIATEITSAKEPLTGEAVIDSVQGRNAIQKGSVKTIVSDTPQIKVYNTTENNRNKEEASLAQDVSSGAESLHKSASIEENPPVFQFPEAKAEEDSELEDVIGSAKECEKSTTTKNERTVSTPNFEHERAVMNASGTPQQFDMFSKDFSLGAAVFSLCSKAFSSMKSRKLTNVFLQNGKLIHSGDFYFYMYQKQLMLYQYAGSSMEIEIPAFVGNVPVTVLHQNFLTGESGVLSDYRMRGLKSAFSFESLVDLDTSFDAAFKKIIDGVSEIKLPNTLKVILGKPFWGCKNLQRLVVPKSLVSCDSRFWEGSGITDLFFNGSVPENLDLDCFYGDVYRRCA